MGLLAVLLRQLTRVIVALTGRGVLFPSSEAELEVERSQPCLASWSWSMSLRGLSSRMIPTSERGAGAGGHGDVGVEAVPRLVEHLPGAHDSGNGTPVSPTLK